MLDKIKNVFYILLTGLMEHGYLPERFTGKIIIHLLNGKINDVEKRDNLKF